MERLLHAILHREKQIMAAIDDLTAELQGVADEADGITAGITALTTAQAQGNQAAVDAAVATIKTAADNMKSHVDSAQAALQPVATAVSASKRA